MNEIFRKNIEALRLHNPPLLDQLKAELEAFERHPHGTEAESYQLFQTPSGYANLLYENKAQKTRVPYHSDDPLKEARESFEKADLQNATLAMVLGVGLGYVPRYVFEHRTPKLFGIIVIEKDPQIFLRALLFHDFTKVFEDDTIMWIINRKTERALAELEASFRFFTTVDRLVKVVSTPRALQIDNAFYASVCEGMIEARNQAVIAIGTSVPDQYDAFKDCVDNLDLLLSNPGISALQNRFEGKTIISVAAGPQVNEHWETLKRVQGKIPIIACDTLYKPMMDRGIQPDFVTAIEKGDVVTQFFLGQPYPDRCHLVAPSVVYRASLDAFEGTKILYASPFFFCRRLGLQPLEYFGNGSSAGNLNINFSVFMGFKNIIMVGHNLAYGFGTNETHVRGTIDPDRERSRSADELEKESAGFKVRTQDGLDIVPTRFEWNIFRMQIENVVAVHTERNFINTAAKGARIHGTKLESLETALKNYVHEDFDIYPELKKALKTVSKEEIAKRATVSYESCSEALPDLRRFVKEGHEILQKIQNWKREIKEREAAGDYFTINELNNAITEILNVKVAAVNESAGFKDIAVSVILPAHMTFEREINQMPGTYQDNYELKRDFILKHEQYFQVWCDWLPKIIADTERAVQTAVALGGGTSPQPFVSVATKEQEILKSL